jgi:hypothetical protein
VGGDEAQEYVHQQETDIECLSGVLADAFPHVELSAIEQAVRLEFTRLATAPVTEFVSLFVERTFVGDCAHAPTSSDGT